MQQLIERRRKEIATLSRSKGRAKLGQMLVEGWRSVQSALDAGAPVTEILVTPKMLEQAEVKAVLESTARRMGFPVYRIAEKEAQRISTTASDQGILAVVRITVEPVEALKDKASIVALDGVQDPGNVGTIIRTAAWFGIDGIVGSQETADFFNPKVVRASMGGLWDVALTRVPDLPAVLQPLKNNGMQLVAADLNGTPLHTWSPESPVVLVIGGEANGLSPEVKSLVDVSVTIDGGHGKGVESLNAGIAAGIIMQHWKGNRRKL